MLKIGDLAAASQDTRVVGDAGVVVHDVTHDSRQVEPGSLYVAVRGFTSDGHDFLDQAVDRGAVAVCVDHEVAIDVPQLVVPSTRAVLGPMAAAVWAHPSGRFKLVGVTGTNGKTTVTHMIEAIMVAAGHRTGLIGTVGARVAGGSDSVMHIALERTTPEASELQRLFARMADGGATVVAMEVSSHALALDRVAGTEFALGAFTNLSQDHLDFHETMEDYFDAKARLFDMVPTAVIEVDGEWGARLAGQVGPGVEVVRVGEGGDVWATQPRLAVDHSTFVLHAGADEIAVRLPIAGRFNIDNALVAAGCVLQLGVDLDAVAGGLGMLEPVPGRFEHVASGSGIDVVVDYAHTPDGVRHAVEAGRGLTDGRLIVVVGAGGDRDRSKRPGMGAATAGADWVFVTSDNPRSEKPGAIIDEVVGGIADRSRMTVEVDRRSAITAAIGMARAGDLVMILGKGHEQGQDIGGTIYPFDDRAVARDAMGVNS